jgi:hypothetical protein
VIATLRAALVAAVVTLTGCATDGGHSLNIDARFAPAQRDAVLEAADEWNVYVYPSHRFDIDGEDWRVLAEAPTGEVCAGAAGCAKRDERLIQIDPRFEPERVRAIALHELGHALGLKHVAGGVMDPNVLHDHLNEIDIAECRRVGACP